eukprot:313914-Prorocentrum_lima.AAC.1
MNQFKQAFCGCNWKDRKLRALTTGILIVWLTNGRQGILWSTYSHRTFGRTRWKPSATRMQHA